MTSMPFPVVAALIVAAVVLLVLVVVLVVGFVTHRISLDSPLIDDDEDDDLCDDTAALLSMLPTTSIVIDDNDDVVRCSPSAYRLGVVSDDAIAEQEVLNAVHEVRQTGGKRGNLDERQVMDDARQVKSSCSKLNHMVSDLLLLIRAQEPITPSSANRLNVMGQLRQVAERLEPLAAQSKVQLNVAGDEDLVINGETDQIDSAVTKLMENAIGYSPANGTVSVSAVKSKDGEQAVIRVIDQGVGIAKKDQARIFERFYRGSSQSERTADGVGLGLAIVKHVALTHHGDVSVWSAPGQGSTFSLTLPLAQ